MSLGWNWAHCRLSSVYTILMGENQLCLRKTFFWASMSSIFPKIGWLDWCTKQAKLLSCTFSLVENSATSVIMILTYSKQCVVVDDFFIFDTTCYNNSINIPPDYKFLTYNMSLLKIFSVSIWWCWSIGSTVGAGLCFGTFSALGLPIPKSETVNK